MLALLFPRPSTPGTYQRGLDMNLLFGIGLIGVLLLAGIGWAIDRWRKRHELGKHAAVHRVRQRGRGSE